MLTSSRNLAREPPIMISLQCPAANQLSHQLCIELEVAIKGGNCKWTPHSQRWTFLHTRTPRPNVGCLLSSRICNSSPPLLLLLPPHLPLSIIALLRGRKLSAIRDPPPHEMSQDFQVSPGLSSKNLLFSSRCKAGRVIIMMN